MTRSTTTRMLLPRWSADTDEWDRVDFDTISAQVEALAAGALEGLASARPAAAATNARMFYRATDTGVLSYSTGAAWVTILTANPVERFSFNIAPGTSTVLPVGWQPAGKSAGSYTNPDTGANLSGGGWPSWLTVDTAPASADAGMMTLAAGEYTASMRLRLDDSTNSTAFPDGSTWTLGYTLTDSGAMLGSPNVVLPPLAMSAALRAFGGLSFDTTIGTAGGRWLKPFVYIGSAAGTNRQFQLRVDIAKLR